MVYTIKQVADKFHMTTQAVRYYEKVGLLPNQKRDDNGIRLFEEDDIEWLSMLRCLRDTGMNIRELQEYVRLFKQGNKTIEQRKCILENHKKRIEKNIDSLKCNLLAVDYKITLCEKGIV